jgi:hypothetical protein
LQAADRQSALSKFERHQCALWCAIGLLIAFKLCFLGMFTWQGRFVMDEFVQLGWAKYLGNGLFDTVWHGKAVGYAVFYKLAHLIGWDATSILLIGRIQTALLACATMAVIYACARTIGESRLRASIIVLILLSFSNFIERIFRTIAEPLAVFFAAVALLVVLRGRNLDARRLLAAGVLSGLAFLTTQKSIYFNLALGLALVADAAFARSYLEGIRRGALLVAGWALAILAYCLVFGGSNPLPILQNLIYGPVAVATTGADAYGSLRSYVVQTLARNSVLYVFCFAGLVLEALRITKLRPQRRICLIFTLVITALVFAHDQPWPYVFIMALPFLALWSLTVFDRLPSTSIYRAAAVTVLAVFVIMTFVRNIQYLGIDNAAQLSVVARAEALVEPGYTYFDGVAMLPNRSEPSTLWLDKAFVLKTLREGRNSEAYRIFAQSPPKVIIWSSRMDAIEKVVGPLIRDSYVKVGANVLLAGRQLSRETEVAFDPPVAGQYQLYDVGGKPLRGSVQVDGVEVSAPFALSGGRKTLVRRGGPAIAFLLPEGTPPGPIQPQAPDYSLFDRVYD